MTKQLVHDPQLDEGIMRRGFPRPMYDINRIDGWDWPTDKPKFLPTPYSAQTEAIALLSDPRAIECIRDKVCSVCGEDVPFEHGKISMLVKDDGLLFYESGPFHPKCLVLTVKLCPHIACSDTYAPFMLNREVFEIWQRYYVRNSGQLGQTPEELVRWAKSNPK